MASSGKQLNPYQPIDPIQQSLSRKLDIAQAEFEQYFANHTRLKTDVEKSRNELTVLYGLATTVQDKNNGGLAISSYELARDQNRSLQQQISEIETSNAYIELQSYIQKIRQELINHHKKIQEEAIVPENATGFRNWIKRNFQTFKKNFLPTTVTAADLAGTVGFVTHIYLNVMRAINKISEGAKFFFGAVASPLALAAIGAGTLMDTYAVWRDEKIKQRKTRYAVNFASLGLLALAMPIVLGVLAAPVVAVPLIFLGLTGLGYAKDAYILKQTQLDLQAEELAIQTKQDELQAAIQFAIANNPKLNNDPDLKTSQEQAAKIYPKLAYFKKADNVNKYGHIQKFKTDRNTCEKTYLDLTLKISQKLAVDPKIQRLSIQVNEHKDRIASLNTTIRHMQEGQQLRKAFLFSIGCLLAGGVFALVPPLAPLAALFTLVGAATILGAVFVSTYLRYKHKNENETAAKAKQQRDPETEEHNTISASYQNELAQQAYDKEKTHLARMEAVSSGRQAYLSLAAHGATPVPSTPAAAAAATVVGLTRLPSTTLLQSFTKTHLGTVPEHSGDDKKPTPPKSAVL